jgi:hypothetical protein
MLQPKKGKLTKSIERKSTSRPMTEEEKKKWGTQLEDTKQRDAVDSKTVDSRPRLQMKGTQTYRRLQPDMPKLKTKKAKAVDNAPMPKAERVAQSFAKPKMKTLKGKIQLALMKAKKG